MSGLGFVDNHCLKNNILLKYEKHNKANVKKGGLSRCHLQSDVVTKLIGLLNLHLKVRARLLT